MNYSELKARCEAIVGRSNAKFGDYINERRRTVYRSFNFSPQEQTFTVSAVAGTASYDLGATFKDEILVEYDGEALPMMDRHTALDRFGDDEGEPQGYSLVGTSITLYPTPDASYTVTVHGYAYPAADFSDASDHDELSDNWPDLLTAGAVADHFAEKGQTDEFMFWEARFQKLLVDCRVADVQRSLAGVMVLEPRSGPHR